ncbi:5-oxoprolinase subunit PxpB [Winogradskyella bathintestinalis]|uniref:5-oxoprolinase subunit PxpB n=1 Tax=Winogradskyella bathintestinalis TaxID=3035208 RepID=A0ABT7ZVI2_9FLAO|nr:5-oxoprolinase subunit PxpB [Winogradskyella bathintestinalis]MDN3492982.1 5-oxoprolinase subunit PxpB [Winogradskyella bathintestinalis]
MNFKLKFSQYNERAILVEWPAIIDENVLHDVLGFKNRIENDAVKEVVEVVSSYSSLLVFYVSTIGNVNDVFLRLKHLYEVQDSVKYLDTQTFNIPVCYEGEFAVDLENYSKEINQSKNEIIRLHSATSYTVYFIGFLPGFLYLGNLDPSLYLDRKTTPNLNVKKGSVAIGGKQTGIYPQDSPGGWHIIGNSPLELFDPKQNPPCFIKAGDKIKFDPISTTEHQKIREEIRSSNFNFETRLVDD